MTTAHPHAGELLPVSERIDTAAVVRAYYEAAPEALTPVRFGTSGHRGRADRGSFNERHVLAIAQAVVDHREGQGITGPLMLGMDTHALSTPAQRSALEVFAANGVPTHLQADDGFTPTPVISWAILAHNRERPDTPADGVVITPSHNPPSDGGFKYNPPHGGPAGAAATSWIQARANALLDADLEGVRRLAYEDALAAPSTSVVDFVPPYVDDLAAVVDVDAIRDAGVRIGVDPLGGSAVAYWQAIRDRLGLDLRVVNDEVDSAFGFMPRDHDGKIRMDCSSPFAMAGLIGMRDRFDVAIGNDPDADRHGIVTPAAGLMNPNHYLVVAIDYLFTHRPGWPEDAAVGKTLVSSALIDRVAAEIGRRVFEVPVGFKWFAQPLFDGACAFAGEESAGASLLRRDGSPWSTDKDGIALGLLAAEIRARTGEDPGARYDVIAGRLGRPRYRRVDNGADEGTRAALGAIDPDRVAIDALGGEPILATLSHAPGNDAPIGGLKLVAESGWIAARPSGTEDIVKVYAESFRDEEHLQALLDDGAALVRSVSH